MGPLFSGKVLTKEGSIIFRLSGVEGSKEDQIIFLLK